MKKILNEDNQIHNFISSSGSGTVISYGSGSGSTSQKVTVPTVPVLVPQHCSRVVPENFCWLYVPIAGSFPLSIYHEVLPLLCPTGLGRYLRLFKLLYIKCSLSEPEFFLAYPWQNREIFENFC
jgi:hypothetical protein